MDLAKSIICQQYLIEIFITKLDIQWLYSYFRDNYQSFSVGAISEESYLRGEKRSHISLRMCFIASAVEMFAITTAALQPEATALFSALLGAQIQEFNIPNKHFPDAIVMSIVIPIIHLLNEESAKEMVFQSGWCQGFRYAIGRYTTPTVTNEAANNNKIHVARKNLNRVRTDPRDRKHHSNSVPNQITLRRCQSTMELVTKDNEILRAIRRHSLENPCSGVLISSFSESTKVFDAPKSINWSNERQPSILNQKKHSSQSLSSSITTIYLEN